MGLQELREAYMEAMMEDPGLGLEGFVRRAAAGEYGAHDKSVLLAFLHGVERDIISSIQTRASASPNAAEEAERVTEERREQIAGLIARYVKGT